MWIFLLSILGLSMFFVMGDLINEHVPSLSWLFPAKHAAPQVIPSAWQLELAPGDGKGNSDYRLSLKAQSDKAGVTSSMVLTCVSGKFYAYISMGAPVAFTMVKGTATTELTFDDDVKKPWEQGQGGKLFPPNGTWFVEKALVPRQQLGVTAPLAEQPGETISAKFPISGLGLYSALLKKCGVTVPVEETQPTVPAEQS